MSVHAELKPGQRLGGYEVTERLVAGGMARVYRGRQTSTGRDVALKVLALDGDESLRTRFAREAQLLASLQHPHILGLIDAGREGDCLYLVVPLVRAGDLADLIAREGGPLALPLVRRAMLELCGALDYAHERGIVHRDIKPANVLLDERGHCVLTDFGIALGADQARLTQAGAYIGTPEFLAPEQVSGEADARSDLYSLGVVLFEMTTGRLPFDAHTPLAWVQAHREQPVPSARTFNASIPEALDRVIAKAMAKEPAQRFQTATQFAAAIREALPEAAYGEAHIDAQATELLPVPVATPDMPTQRLPATPRWRMPTIAALLVIAGLVAWRWFASPSAPQAIPIATSLPPHAGSAQGPGAAAPPAALAPATVASDGGSVLLDPFDHPRHDGAFDLSRWQLTQDPAKMVFAQHAGVLRIRSEEQAQGLSTTLPEATQACVSAQVRLTTPTPAAQATLGISIARSSDPSHWFSCYLYATHAATTVTPACTDQRRSEFRTGVAGPVGAWHSLGIAVRDATHAASFTLDGNAAGSLPDAASGTPTAWTLLISGWSIDGQPVEGEVREVRAGCL